MIGRIWRGWTGPEAADAYETLLRETILPGIVGREGYRGAFLLKRVAKERTDDVEFVTLTLFDDMEAAQAFSHDGDRGAVVPPDARALLSRFDEQASHYEIVEEPGR